MLVETRDAERASLERVSLASVAREELYPWSRELGAVTHRTSLTPL